MNPLTGKTFIITGAGGAIASAINASFHQAGANLALADRPANADRARDQLGTGLAVPTDLSSLQGAQTMLKATLEHYGRVDGLIHTVGGFATGKVLDSSLEQYDQMFDLNMRTLVHAVTACLPAILETGRQVVTAWTRVRMFKSNICSYCSRLESKTLPVANPPTVWIRPSTRP